jgi:hypothetical protein
MLFLNIVCMFSPGGITGPMQKAHGQAERKRREETNNRAAITIDKAEFATQYVLDLIIIAFLERIVRVFE